MENNIKEKDLNLAIAKEIKELNKNENINIILSRDKDVDFTVKNRTEFTNEKKADLFISIHVDAEEHKNEHSGLSVLIPKNDNPYLKQSQILGSALVQSFEYNYQLPVTTKLQQQEQGVWVLKANECPSVLIETGFITTQKDLDYLLNPDNQKKIAQNILNGIEKYAEQNVSTDVNAGHVIQDTVPASPVIKKSTLPSDVLYVLDGKIISKDDLNSNSINPTDIQRINVLKDKQSITKYGDKGKNGVIEIITKPVSVSQTDTVPDKVFTKVENEAEFPGGKEEWIKYIVSKVQATQDSLTEKDFGTCLVKFIVNIDGTTSNVEATTMKDTKLAEIAMNAIRTGPKWIPATQNGRTVAAYRLQPVTLTLPDKK